VSKKEEAKQCQDGIANEDKQENIFIREKNPSVNLPGTQTDPDDELAKYIEEKDIAALLGKAKENATKAYMIS